MGPSFHSQIPWFSHNSHGFENEGHSVNNNILNLLLRIKVWRRKWIAKKNLRLFIVIFLFTPFVTIDNWYGTLQERWVRDHWPILSFLKRFLWNGKRVWPEVQATQGRGRIPLCCSLCGERCEQVWTSSTSSISQHLLYAKWNPWATLSLMSSNLGVSWGLALTRFLSYLPVGLLQTHCRF